MVKDIYINKETLFRLAGEEEAQKEYITDMLGFEMDTIHDDALIRLVCNFSFSLVVVFVCRKGDL